jgi:hypothetical protein
LQITKSHDESEESSSQPSSSESHGRFLVIEDSTSSSILRLSSSLDVILWRRERDRVIGWTNKRAIGHSAIYSRRRCLLKETPRSWVTTLQIHSINTPMSHGAIHYQPFKKKLGSLSTPQNLKVPYQPMFLSFVPYRPLSSFPSNFISIF